jgi:hypothetical protein
MGSTLPLSGKPRAGQDAQGSMAIHDARVLVHCSGWLGVIRRDRDSPDKSATLTLRASEADLIF